MFNMSWRTSNYGRFSSLHYLSLYLLPSPSYFSIRLYFCITNNDIYKMFGLQILKVHTLLKGLEKIAASADIPMLVCGDFNSVPGRRVMYFFWNWKHYYYTIFIDTYSVNLNCSAPHALLAIGKVDPMHPDLAVDPLGILRPATKLTHTLPLVIYSPNFLFVIP